MNIIRVGKMLSKEMILENISEDEALCLFHEFLMRLADKSKEIKDVGVLDRTIGEIVTEMIDDVKKSVYLSDHEQDIRDNMAVE